MKFPELPLVKKKDRTFLYELGKSIVSPAIQLRESSHSFKHLRKDLKSSIRIMTNHIIEVQPISHIPEDDIRVSSQIPCSGLIDETLIKRSRCVFCPRTKDKKIRQVCFSCKSHVCDIHCNKFAFCLGCQDKISII